MAPHQSGINAPVPKVARYLYFQLRPGADPKAALTRLAEHKIEEDIVVGLGQALVSKFGKDVPGLREFPSMVGTGVTVPSTPAALWIWLRGEDPGALVHTSRSIVKGLEDSFVVDATVDGFFFDGGRDSLLIFGRPNTSGACRNVFQHQNVVRGQLLPIKVGGRFFGHVNPMAGLCQCFSQNRRRLIADAGHDQGVDGHRFLGICRRGCKDQKNPCCGSRPHDVDLRR